MNCCIKNKFLYLTMGLIILIGIVIRIIAYNNHSFYIVVDECHSLQSIKNSWNYYLTFFEDGANFLQGYKFLLKSIYSVFGMNWAIFKLPSLIAGIISLFAFASLSLKVFKNKVTLIAALIIFTFCYNAVFYCTMIKAYELDILFTILILNAFITINNMGTKKFFASKKIWYYFPIAVLFIYSSTTSILIIEACVTILLLKEILNRNKNEILKILYFNIILGTFILNEYVTYISQFADSSNLKEQWLANSFFFAPKSFEAINTIFNFVYFDFFWWDSDVPYIYPKYLLIAFVAIFITGTINFIRKKEEFYIGLIVCLPVYTFLTLSYLYIYPFCNRPILFLIPVFILVPLKAFDYNYNKFLKIISAIFCILICLLYLNNIYRLGFYYGLINKNIELYNNFKTYIEPLRKINDNDVMISTDILGMYTLDIPYFVIDLTKNNNDLKNDIKEINKNKKRVYFNYNIKNESQQNIGRIKDIIKSQGYIERLNANIQEPFSYYMYEKK